MINRLITSALVKKTVQVITEVVKLAQGYVNMFGLSGNKTISQLRDKLINKIIITKKHFYPVRP